VEKIQFLVTGFLKEEKTAEEINGLFPSQGLSEVKTIVSPEYLSNSLYNVHSVDIYNSANEAYSDNVYLNPDKINLTKKLSPSHWYTFVYSSILIVIYFGIFSISTFTNPLLTVFILQVILGFAFYFVTKYEIYLKFAKFRLDKSRIRNPSDKFHISSFCNILIVIKCDDIQSGIVKILNLAQNVNALDISVLPIEYVDRVISIENKNQKNAPKLYSAKFSAFLALLPVVMLMNIVSFTLFYTVGKYL
jgi:hypothetical protein